MSSVDVWGILLALLALVIPMGLAWVLLAWGERKLDPRDESPARRHR